MSDNKEKIEGKITEEQLTELVNDILKDAKPSTLVYNTGREGAIFATIQFETTMAEMAKGELLNSFEKEVIKMDVRSRTWEDGVYQIKDGLVKYLGLWDDTMKDGYYVVKRKAGWRVEEWLKGFRQNYRIVSEEKAKEIIHNRENNK